MTTDVWWIDEATDMVTRDEVLKILEQTQLRDWYQTPVYNTTRDSFSDTWEPGGLSTPRPTISRSGYTTRPAFEAPEFFIVQYIGGGFNGEQQYLPYEASKRTIVEGGAYTRLLQGPPPTISHDGIVSKVETSRAIYTLTFVPRDQTPFAESAQVVIALFKE